MLDIDEIDYDALMGEMQETAGDESTPVLRSLNLSGKTGEFRLWEKGVDFDEDSPLSLRKKLEAIILYLPSDEGMELWPDGEVFKGDKVLCRSRRTAQGFDKAWCSADGAAKSVMAKRGWTGNCGNCLLREDKLCKPALNAYIYDLAQGDAPVVTLLNAKGPQSTWGFYTAFRSIVGAHLKKKSKELGRNVSLAEVVVKLSTEPGFQGSKKIKVDIVRDATPAETGIAKALAIDAFKMANKRRSNASASLPASQERRAIAASRVEAEPEVIDTDEIPF